MAESSETSENTSSQPDNEKKKVVLLGLGYVHLHLLKRFSETQNLPFDVTLISEHLDVPMKTMVPDFIAGFCKRTSVLVNSEALVEKSKVEVIRDSATEVDTKKNRVRLSSGQFVRYDFLSINCAARPNTSAVKGLDRFAHLNKPIRAYQKAIMDFCDSLRGRKKVTVVQVGSEYGGLESALSLIRRLKAYGTEANVHLIEPATRLMPNHPKKVSTEMLKVAEANKINVHLEKEVLEVGEGSIRLSDGTQMQSDFTSVALPLEVATWLKASGLKQHSGLLKVNHHLQTSENNVFAVGSVAVDPDRSWPRSYTAAAKQAKILFQNLKASASGLNLKKYRPSSKEIEFVTDGNGNALLTRGSMVLARRPFFWNWKVKRDRKFQEIFSTKDKAKAASKEEAKAEA